MNDVDYTDIFADIDDVAVDDAAAVSDFYDALARDITKCEFIPRSLPDIRSGTSRTGSVIKTPRDAAGRFVRSICSVVPSEREGCRVICVAAWAPDWNVTVDLSRGGLAGFVRARGGWELRASAGKGAKGGAYDAWITVIPTAAGDLQGAPFLTGPGVSVIVKGVDRGRTALRSLAGSPEYVGANFEIHAGHCRRGAGRSELRSLAGSPEEVRGMFRVQDAALTDLSGMPARIGSGKAVNSFAEEIPAGVDIGVATRDVPAALLPPGERVAITGFPWQTDEPAGFTI